MAGVHRLECLCHLQMQRATSRCRQFGQQHLANDVVGERVALRRLRFRSDDPRGDTLVERVQHLRAVASVRARDECERELAADGSRQLQQRATCRREILEPPARQAPHAERHRDALEARDVRTPIGIRTARSREADQLPYEERVAARPPLQRREDAGRRAQARLLLDETADVVRRQAPQRDPHQRLELLVFDDEILERLPARQIVVAHRGHHEHALAPQLAGQVRERVQRVGIQPLQVVHDEHLRADASGALHEAGERLVQPKPALLGVGEHRRRERELLAKQRRDARQLGRARHERVAQALDIPMLGAAAQDLRPEPERGRSGGVLAARPVHLDARLLRHGREFLDEPCLPDACLAHHEREPAAAGDRACESGSQDAEFRCAAHERRRRVRGHGRDGGADRLGVHAEAEPDTANGRDDARSGSDLAERLARLQHDLRDGVVGHDHARPHGAQQLVLANDALAVARQMEEQRQRLRTDRDRDAVLEQCVAVFVEFEAAEADVKRRLGHAASRPLDASVSPWTAPPGRGGIRPHTSRHGAASAGASDRAAAWSRSKRAGARPPASEIVGSGRRIDATEAATPLGGALEAPDREERS